MYNANSPEFLNKILTNILTNLENTKHAPSVQMNYVPNDAEDLGDIDEDTQEAIDTKGGSQQARDEITQPDNEFYEDDDKDAGSRDIQNFSKSASASESKPAELETTAQPETLEEPEDEKMLTDEELKEINELNSNENNA